jgi:hypothetical protein
MIQMISGTTRVGAETKDSASGPFSLPAEQEKSLVQCGVARYVSYGELQGRGADMGARELRAMLEEAGLSAEIGATRAEMVAMLDEHYAER